VHIRDLTILGRQRDDDGQNKLLQINGSKDSSVSTFFHPANRPIDFVKSFLFGFFINSVSVRVESRGRVSVSS
jgi:hypothetical protein